MNASATLSVLSAGAARRLLDEAGPAIAARHAATLALDFAPVGVVLDWLRAGRPADLVVLSREAIERSWPQDLARAGEPLDLGSTETVFVRRATDALGPLESPDALRAALLASPLLLMPDLVRSTGGRHIAQVFERLGIAEALAPRMRHVAGGGLEAGEALAACGVAGALSCAQAVEVSRMPAVASAGMPAVFALRTDYCVAATMPAALPIAREFAAASRAGAGGLVCAS